MTGLEPLGISPLGTLVEDGVITEAEFNLFVSDDRLRARFLVDVYATSLSDSYISDQQASSLGEDMLGELQGGSFTLNTQTLFFGDGYWVGSPTDTQRPNQAAVVRILSSPDIERNMPLYPESSRRGQVQFGDLEFGNPDGALDDLVSGFSVSGQLVRIYLGNAYLPFSSYKLVGETFAESFEADHNKARLRVKSTEFMLTAPAQSSRYSGLGGINGDANIAGRLRPFSYGRIYNLTPVLLNQDQWIYQFHDGPALAVDAVKERGLELTYGGSDYPTYAALRAGSVNPGEYITCKAYGLVKVGFGVGGPTGPVTLDVRGDVVSGAYTELTGEILLRLAERRAKLPSSLIKRRSFSELPRGPIGYYFDGTTELSVGDIFDELLKGVNGWYGTKRESALTVGYPTPPELRVAQYEFSLDTGTILNLEKVAVEYPPRYKQSVSYGKNWTVLSESDISEAVDVDERPLLQLAYQLTSSKSTEVRMRDRAAIDGGILDTYFYNKSDADELARNVMGLFRETRQKFILTTSRIGYQVNIQSIVRVVYPRFGLENGQNFIVTGIRDLSRLGQVQLTLWGGGEGLSNTSSSSDTSPEVEMLWDDGFEIGFDSNSILAWDEEP